MKKMRVSKSWKVSILAIIAIIVVAAVVILNDSATNDEKEYCDSGIVYESFQEITDDCYCPTDRFTQYGVAEAQYVGNDEDGYQCIYIW